MTQYRYIVAMLAFALMALAACESHQTANEWTDATDETIPSDYEAHVDAEPAISIDDVKDVMLAKLVYSRAIFEAMTLGDLETVAVNADELRMIANTAAFRPHATVSYGLLSDEFGVIADQIATAAREQDYDTVRHDYLRLTDSCVKCHDYLHHEAPALELPGSVSMGE